MVVGVLTLTLYLSESQSLKEKRMILNSLKDTLRQQFNVSVAEIEEQEMWQRATLGVAGIGNDRRYVNGQLSRVVEAVQRQRAAELLDYELAWC